MMHKSITLALGLTLAAAPLAAQSGPLQAPVPGPYMIVVQPPAFTQPQFTPQTFAMPLPYWMQNPQPQRQQQLITQTPTQQAPAVGRANQQPASTGWQATPNMANNGAGPTPGFFPSYNTGQPQQTQRPQTPAQANATPYQTNNFVPYPNGQQGFMPMQAPWQMGQYGQNNWGYNGNGYGYGNGYQNGYPQGYRPQNRVGQ